MSRIIKANNFTYTTNKKINPHENERKATGSSKNTNLSSEDIYQETKVMVTELIDQARNKAEQILVEGKIRSEALIQESEMVVEKKYEEAWQKGYSQGKQKAKEEYKELKEDANKLMQQAFTEKENLLNNSEQEIIDFTIDIIDKLYLDSVKGKQAYIVEISKHLINFVKDTKGQVILKASTEDYPFLEKQKEDLGLLLTTGILSIKLDQSLNSGHCILISEQGILEVDLDENLEKVKAALQGGINGN